MQRFIQNATQIMRKRHLKIYLVILMLFGTKRSNYCRFLYDYIEKKEILWFHKFGDKNKDKMIFMISVGDPQIDKTNVCTNGFFSLMDVFTIRKLDIADRLGFLPYVNWGRDVIFAEDELINGTQNAFEYYFEQVSLLTKEEVYHSKNVCFAHELNLKELIADGDLYNADGAEMDRYVYLYKKYIRLNTYMQEYIASEIKNLGINERTLAVHIRGVEWGNIKDHPIPVLLEKYMKYIDKLLGSNYYDQIFIATDSEESLDQIVSHYGKKVLFYPETSRTPKGSKKLVIFNEEQKINEKYNLGVEVIRDMLSLAECGGLIAGLSNVSFFARCEKRSRGDSFMDEVILNNGILSGKGKKVKSCIKNK